MNNLILVVFFIIIIILLLLSHNELSNNVKNNRYNTILPDRHVVIKGTVIGAKHDVILANRFKSDEDKLLKENNIDLNNYSRHVVRKHFVTNMKLASRNIYEKVKRLPKSKEPLNLTYNIISTAVGGVGMYMPWYPMPLPEYIIYKHKDDQFESFIDKNKFYVI